MKIAILDARQGERKPENSNTVAYRNLLEIKKHFNADLYISASQLKSSRDDYDVIICGFGSTSTERDQSTNFLIKNKKAKIYWLVGEYEQSTFAPLFYSKREYHVIKNYEHKMSNKSSSETFLNINLLLCNDTVNKEVNNKIKYPNIYYGRFRKDRTNYINRYIGSGCFISTSPKNMKIFYSQCPQTARATFMKNLAWSSARESLRTFATSIYIEDTFTHTHFNCLANRFYEALNCGTIVLSQPEAINTFIKSKLNLAENRYVINKEDYVNKSQEILNNKNLFKQLFDEQNDWHQSAIEEKRQLILSLKTLFNEAKNG